ncbi:hypothetical protein COT87_01460 [Candidatus Collierbacteria bacterium CG10_big_fil_rev_8_21_14_0_10_44_9]|uniref:DUF541 domain-containing protein n=1 Tax=Candidatus Collierbacteria bacterium CG10_big_fil_rev_8_21_14_0_10_44_9 TaxID=1974535 RepID=A0A2H0VJ17_9BACT|nr:MAG: hypothetical protein COT87_01460 [Candidatus Collierbacteria bacterium CG10_big_fil_rev_8_21_14_0_10_44_9]
MYIDGKKILVIGLALIVTVVFGMWVFSPAEVVVTGTGMVSVPATNVTFNITLNSVNDSVDTALSELRVKVANIKKVLNSAGVTSENIAETQITITPVAAVVASARGYQAMMTLSVKMSKIAVVGDAVVSMYANGATLVSQPVVSVENQEKLETEALKQALKKAENNLVVTVGWKPIRKIVGIQQASSGNIATTIKTVENNNNEFEVVKAVSVTYRVW